jgi:hypothetical protein
MMLLIIPITAALFAFYFIDVLRVPERINFLYRRPFNCNLCLSFWVALLLWLVPPIFVKVLFTGFAASILSVWGIKKS